MNPRDLSTFPSYVDDIITLNGDCIEKTLKLYEHIAYDKDIDLRWDTNIRNIIDRIYLDTPTDCEDMLYSVGKSLWEYLNSLQIDVSITHEIGLEGISKVPAYHKKPIGFIGQLNIEGFERTELGQTYALCLFSALIALRYKYDYTFSIIMNEYAKSMKDKAKWEEWCMNGEFSRILDSKKCDLDYSVLCDAIGQTYISGNMALFEKSIENSRLFNQFYMTVTPINNDEYGIILARNNEINEIVRKIPHSYIVNKSDLVTTVVFCQDMAGCLNNYGANITIKHNQI